MQKITNIADLKTAIQQLENKQATEWVLLNEQILLVRDSLHPLQIIKRSIKETIFPTPAKTDLLGTIMGLTAGFISKALVIGTTSNPVKMLFGALLQLKVTNTVAKNAGTVGFIAENVMKFFNRKKTVKVEEIPRYTEPYKEIF
jgi:hypothetical protein